MFFFLRNKESGGIIARQNEYKINIKISDNTLKMKKKNMLL